MSLPRFAVGVFQFEGDVISGRRLSVKAASRAAGRWRMNRLTVQFRSGGVNSLDANGNRHAHRGHVIENIAGNFRLGLLIGQTPGMKTSTYDGLATIDRRFPRAASE